MSVGGWVIAVSACWLVYGYLGYPVALWCLRRVSPRPVARGDWVPPLSVVIAVHEGGSQLAKKLDATLQLDYPGEVEVIVASDASADETDTIAASFRARGVRLVRNPERAGKEAAQARAIAAARGEILVFTDLAAELEPGALVAIVRPFSDASVGCVSSEDQVEGGEGEGAYVRYEMALRRLESETTTLIGLSGSFFAVRRELCEPWPSDLASDFRIALEAARRGLRAVSEPAARARFRATPDRGAEWSRKVRTVRRGLAVLSAYRDLLHPARGRAAFSLVSHKGARFTSPFALLALLGASLALAPSHAGALALLGAQLAAYAAGGLALARPAVARWLPLRLAGFFLLVNASTLVAWGHHWTGGRAVVWQPTQR